MYDFSKAVIKIENTTLCGASCVMCPRDEFNFHRQVMTLECFKKLSDETYRMGVKSMIFGGFGDPLMDIHLYERLDYIKQNYPDFQISMIDTGHLLEGEKARIVSEYIDVIKISNYGFSKEVYESVHRGSLKYEKVKSNIDEFLSLKKRPFTIMTFLDLPENHHEMAAWKEYYEPKCERIDIWKPHNWGGNAGGGQKEVVVPCKRALLLSDLTFCADGSVSLCCFDFNRKLIIGNILNESLEDIVASEETKRLQRLHKNDAVLSSGLICKDCDQIRDRTSALLYTSDRNMRIGKNSMQTFEAV